MANQMKLFSQKTSACAENACKKCKGQRIEFEENTEFDRLQSDRKYLLSLCTIYSRIFHLNFYDL